MDLMEELRGLMERLTKEGVDFALCGGLAMAIYARPRTTIDIDLLILEAGLEAAKRAAIGAGFTLDAGLMSFRQGKSRIHRMTKVVPDEAEPLMIDFLLVGPDLQEVWDTRRTVPWTFGTIPVVSREGLIRLKELRGSAQDRVDIDQLKAIDDED